MAGEKKKTLEQLKKQLDEYTYLELMFDEKQRLAQPNEIPRSKRTFK